jgi:AcrR family transcriptional regulator
MDVAEGREARLEEEARGRIVRAASALLFAHGYSGFTMERLADELGMSKKTLYQHFAGKEELALAVVDAFFHEVQAGLNAILAEPGQDFPTQLRRVLTFMSSRIARIQRPVVLDVKRSAPRVWEHGQRRRRQIFVNQFAAIIQRGVDTGMVRADLSPPLVVQAMLALIEGLLTPDAVEQLGVNPAELFQAVTTMVFEGILTGAARGEGGAVARRGD